MSACHLTQSSYGGQCAGQGRDRQCFAVLDRACRPTAPVISVGVHTSEEAAGAVTSHDAATNAVEVSSCCTATPAQLRGDELLAPMKHTMGSLLGLYAGHLPQLCPSCNCRVTYHTAGSAESILGLSVWEQAEAARHLSSCTVSWTSRRACPPVLRWLFPGWWPAARAGLLGLRSGLQPLPLVHRACPRCPARQVRSIVCTAAGCPEPGRPC